MSKNYMFGFSQGKLIFTSLSMRVGKMFESLLYLFLYSSSYFFQPCNKLRYFFTNSSVLTKNNVCATIGQTEAIGK